MFQLDYRSGVSICDQIVNGFIRMKALGVLKGGDQLPSVRSLAMQLSVNPNTIQKAYQFLEMNGIIYSLKGKGSYISDDNNADLAVIKRAIKSFEEAVLSARELGLSRKDVVSVIDNVYKEENE